jgi:aspartyl-tRNA(Asn)/glutamyl-tRNA(Gln) amidotransferase subunit A
MSSMTADITSLPAHVLSREIGARRLSPVDFVGALLDRTGSLDPKSKVSGCA